MAGRWSIGLLIIILFLWSIETDVFQMPQLHKHLIVIGYSTWTHPNMKERRKHQFLTYFIATVWFINGLVCKVLNLVPRHEQIVGRILNVDRHSANIATILIGFLEIAMAVWILSGILTRLNAVTQIIVIALMNTLEFILVPDLLLWGKANAAFAFMFILLIHYNRISPQ